MFDVETETASEYKHISDQNCMSHYIIMALFNIDNLLLLFGQLLFQ